MTAHSNVFVTLAPGTFVVISRHAQSEEHRVSNPACTFPAGVREGDPRPSCVSFYTVNRCILHSLFSAMHFALVFFLGDSAISNSTQAQCWRASVPQHKKALMCLMEKIRLEKLEKASSGHEMETSSTLMNQ